MSLVQFLILVENRFKKHITPGSSRWFNLFNCFARSNYCSCLHADMNINCPFLITYDLSCTILQNVIPGSGPHWQSGIHIDNILHLIYELWCPDTLFKCCECFLCLTTGSMLEASNFWTVSTNNMVTSKNNSMLPKTMDAEVGRVEQEEREEEAIVQQQRIRPLCFEIIAKITVLFSSHILAESLPLMLWKDKSPLIIT